MAGAILKIGVDTGGTFTDLVLDPGDGSGWVTHKLPSTRDDPGQAVITGISEILLKAGLTGNSNLCVVHGSTVATNALLEGRGARTGFVTTAGFEDILFIGRQRRPELYDLEPQRTAPPVDSSLCLGLAKRITVAGKVEEQTDRQCTKPDDRNRRFSQVEQLAQYLTNHNVESVVVCLLHSYANPDTEQQLAATLRQELPGVPLTVSSELLPEFREYERAATCLANAVVAPRMAHYIGGLTAQLGADRLRIMGSAGCSLPPATVISAPVQTLLSGPAGGVLGAFTLAAAIGEERIITFDMGGTSTDVALCDGQISSATENTIGPLPVRIPMVAVHTVGAGGGSMAWIDSGGALRVGPQSTGADPGPACYGRQTGTLQAAVTDAHVVLGTLPADKRLSGTMDLDPALAKQAVANIADSLKLDLHTTAEGILRIADAAMARAIQKVSVQQGHDPRHFALVPFGGAGGLHATRLADLLGLPRILVPPHPGLLSACGMLAAVPGYDFSQAVMTEVQHGISDAELLELPAVATAVARLHQLGRQALNADRIAAADQIMELSFDLRYHGQSWELTIPAGSGSVADAFARRHHELYGYVPADQRIEIVTARIHATIAPAGIDLEPLRRRNSADPPLTSGTTNVYGWDEPCMLTERDQLLAGDQLTGPAIVAEYSSTTIVPPGWTASVLDSGFIRLERGTGP